MGRNIFDIDNENISWCPGCGNFQILDALKDSLARMDLNPRNIVIVSGIGQAGKTPHYLSCNMFNGLHGRTLPVATGVKASNPGLTVLAVGGDGDMYGEGGNHLLHAIRRNSDITNIVHNNMVYGLTKGQASPTSLQRFVTPVQVHGVSHEPFNPVAMAITLNASFVARAFSGDGEQTSRILEKAVRHRGYALVDILQPCVTFNRINTYQWFRDNSYYLEDSYDPSDRMGALEKTVGQDRFALGVLYTSAEKPTFEEGLPVYADSSEPLRTREVDREGLFKHIQSKA